MNIPDKKTEQLRFKYFFKLFIEVLLNGSFSNLSPIESRMLRNSIEFSVAENTPQVLMNNANTITTTSTM
ncbi:CLUMA_CG015546, isoform A [Clunio marinus]|uniref:CLUMA_CG015546, isoform A n=1 Tax=Clunio marinus TaxID=568069 RepID=A0A1J1ISK8_9DIPT|nr:CLUMA_CG015546, isoform A [Clunio marinus]